MQKMLYDQPLSPYRNCGPTPLGRLRMPVLNGYAAVYDRPFWYRDHWRVFSAGCFDRMLGCREDCQTKVLINHLSDFPVVDENGGKLQLECDSLGLFAWVRPQDNEISRNLILAMQAGHFKFFSNTTSTLASNHSTYLGEDLYETLEVGTLSEISFCNDPDQEISVAGFSKNDSAARSIAPAGTSDVRNRVAKFLESVSLN